MSNADGQFKIVIQYQSSRASNFILFFIILWLKRVQSDQVVLNEGGGGGCVFGESPQTRHRHHNINRIIMIINDCSLC